MIRVLIADDHKLFRIGLQKMLRDNREINVIGEARSGEEAVTLARELSPNVVLMDISMEGIGGLEATRRITQRQSDIRVIVLTAFEGSPYPVQALKAGATGYLTKKVNSEELLKAIKRVFLGQRYLCGEVAQQLAVTRFSEESTDPFVQLSSREMQIMLMVVNCQKVREISNNLHLSPKTVNSYRYRIFEKLNVGSDVELALMAVRYGVVSEPAGLNASAAL